ncbi:FHA domain-containing protein [Paludisphaera mucosa]|uniref:FHA domain-containing protein n=1 Tax=Paludisphaera mucosa TaxID=3030827 RepID=A0ABT6FI67_9BACT|nr:FHA domain-containing protein [Paludisphaera mucosa]
MRDSRVALVLLDTPNGRPRQHWFFEGKDLIRIGRSTDNDVVVADQLVSREHVYLTRDGDAWILTVLSPQGIFCGPRKLLGLRLEPQALTGFLFRLGVKGPFIRLDPYGEATCEETTVGQVPDQLPLLLLDVEKLRKEVDEISEGDVFRSLKDSLKRLKGPRTSDPNETR